MSLPGGLPLACAPSAAQLCGLGSEGAEHQRHRLLSEAPKAPLPAWPLSPFPKVPSDGENALLSSPGTSPQAQARSWTWGARPRLPGSREAERAPEARRCAAGAHCPPGCPSRPGPAAQQARATTAPAGAESPISTGGLGYYFLSGGI